MNTPGHAHATTFHSPPPTVISPAQPDDDGTHLPQHTRALLTANTAAQRKSKKRRLSDMNTPRHAHATTFHSPPPTVISPALSDEDGARLARHARGFVGSGSAGPRG
ncbi:hypothetical protein Acsp04_43260 [Actinomadura sp. NBRC 104425]|nr:hypothetical protein Acsp04_43260 [Actinomadura sp. NBRC 104425]